MRKNDFYTKYANSPIGDRMKPLTYDHSSPIFSMTLHMIYEEIHQIDEKLRADEIRREKLLEAVEPFLTSSHHE